jgi:hypothetical protein
MDGIPHWCLFFQAKHQHFVSLGLSSDSKKQVWGTTRYISKDEEEEEKEE